MNKFTKFQLSSNDKKSVKGGTNSSNPISDILEAIGIIIHDIVDG